MGGNADRHRIEPRGHQIRDPRSRAQRQHEAERSGPEGRGQAFGLGADPGDGARGLQIGQMHDQRVEARPALRLEDPRDRHVRARVAAKAIDRLGRKGDKLALAQQRGGGGKAVGIGAKGSGFHRHGHFVTQR